MKSRANHIAAIFIFAITFAFSNGAVAQTASKESKVLGFTSTGQEVVVRTEHQGELLVDDAAQPYYFETTDVYRARDGAFIRAFQHGTLVGPQHPDWKAAKPAADGEKFLANAGMDEAVEGWRSPNGKLLVTAFNQEAESNKGCALRERLLLLNQADAMVHVLRDGQTTSSSCARVTYKPLWSPDSSRFVLERRAGDAFSLLGSATDVFQSVAEAPFVPWAAAESVMQVGEAALVPVWNALFQGDFDAAMQAIGQVHDQPRVELIRYLILALKGAHKEAAKGAKTAFKNSAKTALDEGILAAVYMVAGNKRGAKHIKNASKDGPDYATSAQLGALFSIVDLSLSNQLLINALSHESAKDIDTTAAYELLTLGLIDAGEFDAAADLIAKIEEPSGATQYLDLRLKLIRKEKRLLPEATARVFAESGRCGNFAVLAQAQVKTNPALALQYFETAAFCDPSDAESQFYLGDFAIRRGEFDKAQSHFQAFLAAAPPRAQDPVRSLRVEHVKSLLPRLAHKGVVLLNVTCRATDCTGTVFNNGEAPAGGVLVKAIEYRMKRGKATKKKDLGKVELPEIAPGATASFSISPTKMVKTLALTAGQNKDEESLNFTRP